MGRSFGARTGRKFEPKRCAIEGKGGEQRKVKGTRWEEEKKVKRRFLELEQKGVTRGENKYERTHHCKETAPNELVSSQSCAVHPTFDPPTKHLSANKRYISRVVRHVRVLPLTPLFHLQKLRPPKNLAVQKNGLAQPTTLKKAPFYAGKKQVTFYA